MLKVDCEKAYDSLQKMVCRNMHNEILLWYCIMINMALDNQKERFEIAKTEFMARYVSGPVDVYVPGADEPIGRVVEGQVRMDVIIQSDDESEPHVV